MTGSKLPCVSRTINHRCPGDALRAEKLGLAARRRRFRLML